MQRLTVLDHVLDAPDRVWMADAGAPLDCERTLLRHVASDAFVEVADDDGHSSARAVSSDAELRAERERVVSALEVDSSLDLGAVCARVLGACVEAVVALRLPRESLGFDAESQLTRVRCAESTPFLEPWSTQFDMAFEASRADLVSFPSAAALRSSAVVEAWARLSARPGRIRIDFARRGVKAIPHELVHCMQTLAGQRDTTPNGWRAEHDASLVGGLLLRVAVPSEELAELLVSWSDELNVQEATMPAAVCEEEYVKWRDAHGKVVPGSAVADTPGASYYLKSRLQYEAIASYPPDALPKVLCECLADR